MKLKKILAVLSATAMAASMAVVASAGTFEVPAENIKDNGDGSGTAYLVGDAEKGEDGPFNDKLDELAKYVAVKITIELDEAEAADCADIENGSTWVGGGVGCNSESTGWESYEWTPKAYELDADGNIHSSKT